MLPSTVEFVPEGVQNQVDLGSFNQIAGHTAELSIGEGFIARNHRIDATGAADGQILAD